MVYVGVRRDKNVPPPSHFFATTCFERTTGEIWSNDDLIIIGEGDTPTSPASDLRSSDADVSD